MSDPSDTPSRRRKRRRKATAATPAAEPAVQVILEQALHPDPVALDAEAADVGMPEVEAPEIEAPEAAIRDPSLPAAGPSRRRRDRKAATLAAATPAVVAPEVVPDAPHEASSPESSPAVEAVGTVETRDAAVEAGSAQPEAVPEAEPVPPEAGPTGPFSDWHDVTSTWKVAGDIPETPPSGYGDDDGEARRPRDDAVPPHDDDAAASGHGAPPARRPAPATPHAPVPHHWVYLAVGLFVAALGFGVWGVWTVFFAGGDGSGTSVAALRTRSDRLSQEVSTLRRSDQISRDANRDLERTLAERDEEIASLRADIAFYERFVGATGQRRGLSVHDLEMRRQDGDAWHFVATLTQNVNRGAVNSGRLTLSIEGTRRDRMERLAWTTLRKQPNAPGAEYSFKYFQQLEGEILLPADFKPLRVTVRLVPQGGAAVEQSFPWPETLHSVAGG
jgi:hypothetical protein